MAQYKSWGWLTNITVSGGKNSPNPQNATGEEFTNSSYRDDLFYRDGDEDDRLSDLDSTDNEVAHDNDGVAFDRTEYNYKNIFLYNAQIHFSGETEPYEVMLRGFRLHNEDNPGGPNTNVMLFRLVDSDIRDIENMGLNRTSIDRIVIGEVHNSDVRALNVNNHNAAFPCFCAGSLIETPGGRVRVEDLEVNDLVLTRDNGAQPIRWINQCRVEHNAMEHQTNLWPVSIAPDALGENRPNYTLMVSQQHRILLRNKIAQRVFGTHEVLTPAKNLLSLPGVDLVQPTTAISYYHILLDAHQILIVNALETESLYLGPMTRQILDEDQWQKIARIFPGISRKIGKIPVARPVADTRSDVDRLVERAIKNRKLLQEATMNSVGTA